MVCPEMGGKVTGTDGKLTATAVQDPASFLDRVLAAFLEGKVSLRRFAGPRDAHQQGEPLCGCSW
jgi:hypothetical protein